MPSPLDGLLVVAIEQAVAAPLCTSRLCDAGARVIKIERREGETARHYDTAVAGTSAYFAWLNRGKESAVLDLKDAGDLAIVGEMISRADIFVQNLAPGATLRLGLGAEELVRRYPRLIALDIVGYRQTTPAKAKRAYDMLVQAESGLCSVTGTPVDAVKIGVSVADIGTGMNAYSAIMQALYERERTRLGQAIEISLFDSMAEWMAVPVLHYDYANRVTPRTGLSHASIFPYHVARCSDGELVIVVQNPLEWQRFCVGVLRQPVLADDPRFFDNPSRVKNREALAEKIQGVFAVERRLEMIERLEGNRLAWGNVSSIEEVSKHQALRRVKVSLPSGAVCEMPASPVFETADGLEVPALGAHTAKIRAEFSADGT